MPPHSGNETGPCSTLVELLRQRSIHQADQEAFTFLTEGEGEVRMTYGELDQRARTISAMLRRLAIANGDRVLLFYPPGLEYIAAFFGCLYAGVIAIPAYPPQVKQQASALPARLCAMALDAQPRVALTTAGILERVEAISARTPEFHGLLWLATDQIETDACAPEPSVSVSAQTVAFLQYTSGSTGTPKGVTLTHGNLLHNLAQIQATFGHSAESRGVIWLPPYHDMGLIGGILQPIYSGFPVTLMAPITFLQRPLRWLEAISQYRATTSGGPNFAYDLCVRRSTPEERAGLDLSSWQVAFNGAEPVRAETLERFAAAFAVSGFRPEAFLPCYGLAEATLIVSGGRQSAPPIARAFETSGLEHNQAISVPVKAPDSRLLVSAGRNLPSQLLQIVHPKALTPCVPGTIGEIWVASPSVAQGYWGRSDETQATFNAKLAETDEGPFLRTGDLGFIQDGELFVTGRIKDLIIIRGQNHYPQDLERTAELSHPALRQGCGAAFTVDSNGAEQLVVVYEIERQYRKTDLQLITSAVRQAIAEHHAVQVQTVVLLNPGGIPKTSSGKIQRHACSSGFLQGTLPVLQSNALEAQASADTDESSAAPLSQQLLAADTEAARQSVLETYLQRRIASLVRATPAALSLQQPVTTFGLDSLMAIELQHEAESQLEIRLALTSFLQGASIAELAADILGQLAHGDRATRPAIQVASLQSSAQRLSHGQQALWFLHQLAPESAAYTIASALRITTALQVPALERAFQRLAVRHSVLRTTFPLVDGQPALVIRDTPIDFRHNVLPATGAATLLSELSAEIQRPFDLAGGPIVRVRLFTHAAENPVLLLSAHHIALDFWSLALLLKELGALYASEIQGAPAELAALTWEYQDFINWQRSMLAGTAGEKLWSYWQGELAGELPVLNLPFDKPRPPVQTYNGAAHFFTVNPSLARRLKELAAAERTTLYTALLSVFHVLLQHWSQQDDIIVGSPMAGRSWREFAELPGYFANPVPLRAHLGGNPTFQQVLRAMRERVLGALEHQEYPFPLLVERLSLPRDTSRTPLFQVMFALEKSQHAEQQSTPLFVIDQPGRTLNLGGLLCEPLQLPHTSVQFDLALMMEESGGQLTAALQYNTDLFRSETIARMAEHYQTLLASVVEHPERRLSDLAMLPAAEQRQILNGWNETAASYDLTAPVHALFEQQVARTPDAVATMFEGEQQTYGELNQRANQLAQYLRSLGVGPDVRVGICVERSLAMVVGLLGILKAGGTHVPLDPKYPQERLALMLDDARIAVLLTQGQLVSALPPHGAPVVCLDSDWPQIATCASTNAGWSGGPENLAYIIYTSGSTGRPKGVQIPHRALTNFLLAMREQPGLTAEDILLSVTTLSFDIAGLELYLPLITGAALRLVSQTTAMDSQLLLATLKNTPVTAMQATPATWQLLLDTEWPGQPGLKALCGGEALSPQLAQALLERGLHLWNMYGPTETTIWSTCWKADAGAIKIGRPIANTQIYLLDAALQPVPIGVPGELWIGGDGLARGYFQAPDLTAEKFIPHLWSDTPGKRMYRTGDLARYTADGQLEHLGRIDHQVKLRGFRIELGEIEHSLARHPGVQEAVVVAREDAPGDKRLVAYLVAPPAASREQTGADYGCSIGELRDFLRANLPEYMLPAAFVWLEALPRTPNGKTDRRALPAPEAAQSSLAHQYVAPSTSIEHTLAQIWGDILGHSQVGIHDDFFQLGGHSLLAAQVLQRVRGELGVNPPLHALFALPTIAGLATLVERESHAHAPRPISKIQVRQRGKQTLDQLVNSLSDLSETAAKKLLEEKQRGA